MATIQESYLSPDEVLQVDCNNPGVDFGVVARLGAEQELVVTNAGLSITAQAQDGVPFSCPLLKGIDERGVESFVTSCSDCPNSYISLHP